MELELKKIIGARLQEERKRLGFNQGDFAQVMGISRRTQSSYESGSRDVGSTYLSQADSLGLDVLYVITGRTALAAKAQLSTKEELLVKGYRALSTTDQDVLLRLSSSLAST